MYPEIYRNPDENATGNAFWDQFGNVPGTIESYVPTFDKTLDAYFDRHFSAIIEEWELVTETDLDTLSRRLERVTDEISRLYESRAAIESRVHRLDDLIATLEGSK